MKKLLVASLATLALLVPCKAFAIDAGGYQSNVIPLPLVQTGRGVMPQAIQSGMVAPSLLQHATFTLTAAQIDAMYTTPITLITGVPGLTTLVDRVFIQTPTGNTFAGGGAAVVQYHTGAVAATATAAATVFTTGTPVREVIGAVSAAAVQGDNVEMTNATAVFTGAGGATVDVWYKQL